ncbi:hypothetical protein ACP4OV_018170 [Aristida adscensionis]
MAAMVVSATTAVFDAGRHAVAVKHVEHGGAPKPVMMVATPTDSGAYPVAIFLHGFNLRNGLYESLLRHVASHGFIVVAPRLYGFTLSPNDGADIDTTRDLAASLPRGLAGVLDDAFQLRGAAQPDLARLALAGHSRGGDTAFAVALGLPTDSSCSLAAGDAPKFSALIGVDPVAGFSPNSKQQTEPAVLTFEPRTLEPGMPALVIGTGLGPRHVGGVPCAPVGLNHAEFYDECAPPRYHAVARDYGRAPRHAGRRRALLPQQLHVHEEHARHQGARPEGHRGAHGGLPQGGAAGRRRGSRGRARKPRPRAGRAHPSRA